MSDPRFQPRLMAEPFDRHKFGKTVEISWLEGSTELEKRRIAAARLQHALAVQITARLREKRQNIRVYAEHAGVSYDRMAKVLRGEALLRLEDVADAERILGSMTPMLEYRVAPQFAVTARHLRYLEVVREQLGELTSPEPRKAVQKTSDEGR